MIPETLPTVTLAGKTYPLVFAPLARMRYSSIPAETRGALQYPATEAMMLWACIAVTPNPFPTWEHLFAAMTEADLPTISEAMQKVFPAATEEKKNSTENGPLPSSGSG